MSRRTSSCSLLAASLLVPHLIVCRAADTPAGSVTCAAPFQLDGLTVSNTATLFVGSRIEDSNGSCIIHRADGGEIRLWPGAGAAMTPQGVSLAHGLVRMTGRAQLRIPSAAAYVQPDSIGTIVNAQFVDGKWTLNVAKGSAQVMGDHLKTYARLSAGTLLTFLPAPDYPLGVFLQVSGCLQSEKGGWALVGEHFSSRIELVGSTIRKNRQAVWVAGTLEALLPDSGDIIARLNVFSEQPANVLCKKYSPVTAIAAGVAGGVMAAISPTLNPGGGQPNASVP